MGHLLLRCGCPLYFSGFGKLAYRLRYLWSPSQEFLINICRCSTPQSPLLYYDSA
jgi:hypothetical protein